MPDNALYTPHLLIKILRECQAQGMDRGRLLHGTGLDEARLYDAATRVTLKQTLQLAGNGLRLSKRPGLGLQIGSRSTLNDGGLTALAAASSGRFWQKAQLSERYHKLCGQILIPSWLDEGKAQVYRLSAPEPLGEFLPFFVEECFSALVAVINQNYQTRITPTCIRLAYSPPAHAADYAQHFHCPVEFNAIHNEFVFDFFSLSTEHRPAHPLNFSVYQQLCETMDTHDGIVDQVKALLLQHGDDLSMEAIAAKLATTPRTLARHLAQQGESFQDLKDAVRMDRAMQLLRHTQLPIQRIAEANGFLSVRRFRDFFARHQGQTPSAFRQGSTHDCP